MAFIVCLSLWACGDIWDLGESAKNGNPSGDSSDGDLTDTDFDSLDTDDGELIEKEFDFAYINKLTLGYPSSVDFDPVKYGEGASAELTLSNAGELPLEIYGYELCPGNDCPSFTVDMGEDISRSHPKKLKVGGSCTWHLGYTRLDAEDATAELWIESNHRGGQLVLVELHAFERGVADLALVPSSLDFPDTSVLRKAFLTFDIENAPKDSTATRTIELVSIEANQPFYPQATTEDGTGCFGPMQGVDRYLASGGSRTCMVMFHPAAGGPFEGVLIVTYDDGSGNKALNVPLTGTGILPYLTLSKGALCGDNSFGDVTVGYSRSEVVSVINSSMSEETLKVYSASMEASGGAFSIQYFPFDPESGLEGLDEPEVEIGRGDAWSFNINFAPVEEGVYDSSAVVLETNAYGYDDGIVEIPICGNGVQPADSVIGLILGVPAIGIDAGGEGVDPVLPVARAPIFARGTEYITSTDNLGSFTLRIPPEDRPEELWLVVDGTRASNGPFSTHERMVELSPYEAVELVIILGEHDSGNSQPAVARDDYGADVPMDGGATNLDDDLSDVLLMYDPESVVAPPGETRGISIRRASIIEFPQPFPSGLNLTPDPYHIYRFLPLGLQFTGHRAKLRLPNSSAIPIGSSLTFYMLDGDPPVWQGVADMEVVEEALSQFGSVIVTKADGRGIEHFGRSEGLGRQAYDSIGFLGRQPSETPYTINGYVREEGGLGLGGLPVQLIGPNVFINDNCNPAGNFNFIVDGVPGQQVIIGAYRENVFDGTWKTVSISLPAEGHEIDWVTLYLPPVYETGSLIGTLRYDDGELVGSGGFVSLRWVDPVNADGNPANDDPNADIIWPPAYTTPSGVYQFGSVRETPDGYATVFATEPLYDIVSGERQVEIIADETSVLDFVISRTDNVSPFIRNAYPPDGGYDLPITANLQVTLSEGIDPETLNDEIGSPNRSIFVTDSDGADVPVLHFFDERGDWLVIQAAELEEGGDVWGRSEFKEGEIYTLRLTTDITDPLGNQIRPISDGLPSGVAYEASFRTVEPEVSDGNECTFDRYDWDTTEIVNEWLEDGAPCNDDGYDCTDDICRSGGCIHQIKEGYCLIEVYCREHHVTALNNMCLWCDTTISQTEWSVFESGPCNDLDPRTFDDTCDASGDCIGIPCECEEPGQCCNGCLAYAGALCSDEDPCTYDDICSEAGVCVGKGIECIDDPEDCGTRRFCNGTDTCTVVSVVPGESCDDGIACTYNDVCQEGGGCAGTPYTCEPDECETGSVCDGEGGCIPSNKPAGEPCGDPYEDACDKPDTCDGNGLCRPNFEPVTTVCREAAFDCDAPETCDGEGSCPADEIKEAGDACGNQDSTSCDNPDTCDRSGNCLPNYEPSVVVCRPAANECDIKERCDGAGNCPEDVFQSSGAPCGNRRDEICTDPDTCDGGGLCSPNDEPPTTLCREAVDECDVDDYCDGVGSCSENMYQMSGTPCGDQTDDICTNPNSCDGLGTCSENHEPETTECRPAGGECNAAEYCDGEGNCPDDVLSDEGAPCGDQSDTFCDKADSCDEFGNCQANIQADTTPCRWPAGECDILDYCDGGGSCGPDEFKTERVSCGDPTDNICTDPDSCDGYGNCAPNDALSTVLCREAVSECDADDYCDELGNCPADGYKSAGTLCGDPAQTDCTNPDICDGRGTCLANHEATTTVCRQAVDDCDQEEYCDGLGDCPPDGVKPVGAACGDQTNTACDKPDTCDGSGSCFTNLEPAATLCRPAVFICDEAEYCTGSDSDCPVDLFKDATVLCRASVDLCDAEEYCTGTGEFCPEDVLKGPSVVCRAVAGNCDYEEKCTGTGTACPEDVVETSGVTCRAPTEFCDLEETCDGSNGACPTDTFKDSGTPCGSSSDTQCDNPDTCNGNGACQENHENSSIPCDDSDSCTNPDLCDGGGECKGTIIPPQILSSIDTLGDTYVAALDVYVSNDMAYIADGYNGVPIYDISNPSNIQFIGNYGRWIGRAKEVHVSGVYIYSAASEGGLEIFNASDPANPTTVGKIVTPGGAEGIYVSGNYAYIADTWDGLTIINVSDPANPSIVTTFDVGGYAYDVWYENNHAFVVYGGYSVDAALKIINVSDPNSPYLVGTELAVGVGLGVFVSGNYAYVADGAYGLRVIDISTLSNPYLVGTYNSSGSANDVYVYNSKAYVAGGPSGLQVIDVSNPNNPQLLATTDTPGEAMGVAKYGADYAIVADEQDGGVQVFDVSCP